MTNGRSSREARRAAQLVPSDADFERTRRLLFGDRFKGGFGLRDPAYMPLYPHEFAKYLYSDGRVMWDKNHSAEDLEGFVDQAPAWELLGRDDRSERWYDDSSRLAAKWILNRLRSVPSERQLQVTFWETMESVHPHIADMQLSTAQKVWARGAALRIIDAWRAEGRD